MGCILQEYYGLSIGRGGGGLHDNGVAKGWDY